MRRMGCAFALFMVLIAGLVALLVSLFGAILGGNPGSATNILIVLAVILGFVLVARGVRSAARPVGDLIEAAGRIEEGDLAARVPERGPREVRALARAFNAMSERLEATEAERRRLFADVSHELRTPLTVIQGNLEGMLDEVYPSDAEHLTLVLDETRLMERLIEDLRLLSLATSGALQLEREPTDLAALLRDVVAGFRAQADADHISLTVATDPQLPMLQVDPARIRAVAGNLVANALRYTPSSGTVSVAAAMDGPKASVTIADTGRGMAREELERVFDRFSHSPDSPGSGLGLAIARALVEAHGGEITATSEPERGTKIRFTLPLP